MKKTDSSIKETGTPEHSNRDFSLIDLKVILLGGRRWIISVGLLVALGVWFNWDLLVSIGAASVILAVAPCLVMCSLGLCMNKASCKKKKEDNTNL